MKDKICYNCDHRSEMFRINGMRYCHCEHPDEKISGDKESGWDTVREFWVTCKEFKPREKELMGSL